MFSHNDFTEKFNSVFDDVNILLRNGARKFLDENSNYSNTSNNKTVHYKDGALHREDGPAVVYSDKSKPDEYWLDGRRSTKEEVAAFLEDRNNNKRYLLTVGTELYEMTGSKLKELEGWLANNSENVTRNRHKKH